MIFTAGAHRFFFLFGTITLAFGCMLGAVPTSVPQFILIINWLLEGGFAGKWQRLKSNRVFWALELIFLIYLAGLFYSSDWTMAIKDLQIKLPLLLLPLVVFSTSPLKREEFHWMLFAFLAGSVVNTAWCLLYSYILNPFEEGRQSSRFMSHIRLGLYLNMAIITCFYFARQVKGLTTRMVLLALYFILSMFLLGLATGLSILALLLLVFMLYAILKLSWPKKILLLLGLAMVAYFGISALRTIYREQLWPKAVPNNQAQKFSLQGNRYIHFDERGNLENGYYIHINIQLQELQRSWNQRCPADSFSFPPDTHNLRRYEALIRYLSGMGLNKDSVGVSHLTETDIRNVRLNIPNPDYPGWSFLRKRLYELLNEYDDFRSGREVNGNSLTMRYYFWKAAWYAIGQRPWIGVGTGDVEVAMKRAYLATDSPLSEEWHKRPHNQFLTVAVGLGLTGLFLFLLALLYPVIRLRQEHNVLGLTFTLVYLLSFLMEDTIETQAGVTFFAFFNTYLMAEAWFRRPQNSEDQPATR